MCQMMREKRKTHELISHENRLRRQIQEPTEHWQGQ